MKVCVEAPAKINLSLDVTGRLENGYHTVNMVMQTVSLTDTVEITAAEQLSVRVEGADLEVDDHNTAWKAVLLYSEKIGVPPHFAVTLHKRIPMQAGMAGGSADAAGVLVGLNALFDNRLSQDELCALGAKIGADVPFCIVGGTMLATGIGTDLEEVTLLGDCYIVAAKPFCGVSTAAAYAAIDTLPYPEKTHTEAVLAALKAADVTAVGGAMHNRFAEVLDIPEVQTLVDALKEHGAVGACMTGSGSAVIGLFTEKDTADRCVRAIAPQCETAVVCTPWQGGPKIV